MTGTRMRAVLLVGLVASVGAFAADVDRHRQFMTDGIYDPALPNAEAYRIVREGIESDDAEAAYLTVAALTLVAMVERLAEHGIDDWYLAESGKGRMPRRDYSKVPGLKEFLIRYWRAHHEENGYDADFDNSDRTEEHDGSIDWTHISRSSAWRATLGVLCRFYPGDAEVHELLWEVSDNDLTPKETLRSKRLSRNAMRVFFVCAGCRGSSPRSGEGRRAFGRFSTPHPGGSPQGGEGMMEELNAGL